MIRFRLVIRPDGRGILTTTERLEPGQIEAIRAHVHDWEVGKAPMLIVPQCEVVEVKDVEIDLGAIP